MKTRIEPATQQHGEALAREIRDEDRQECLASGFESAEQAITVSLEQSTEAYAVFIDDNLICIFGVDARGDIGAIAWVLTSRAVEGAKLSFMKASRVIVDALLQRHRVLFNLVDARYDRAISWLSALGFSLSEARAHPVTGAPFILATLRSA